MTGAPLGDDRQLRRVGADAEAVIRKAQDRAYARTRDAIGVEPLPLKWDYGVILAECEVSVIGPPDDPDAVLILRPRADDLYLESIATLPRAAGQGLASAMMQATLRRARELQRPAVRLITHADNPAAPWYLRSGFAIERREVLPDRVGLHMVASVK